MRKKDTENTFLALIKTPAIYHSTCPQKTSQSAFKPLNSHLQPSNDGFNA